MLETPFEQGRLTQSMLFDHITENNILSISPDSSTVLSKYPVSEEE